MRGVHCSCTCFFKRSRILKTDFLVVLSENLTQTWIPDLAKRESLILGPTRKSTPQSLQYYRPDLLLVRLILIKTFAFYSHAKNLFSFELEHVLVIC